MATLNRDDTSLHATLLSDRTRTHAFLRAIRNVVRPEDVVVEIGTGTALLAMAAIRAGARHVYALEAGPIARIAAQVISANGMSSRITLIRGWSYDVRLPEKADVLVCELIGHEPFGERLLKVTADAVKRFLKPRARSIPARIKIFALPIVIPRAERGKLMFSADVVREWESSYGFDLSPLITVNRRRLQRFFFDPARLRSWRVLSRPIPLFDVACTSFHERRIESTMSVTASDSGTLSGIAIYFELVLTKMRTHTLSSHPAAVTPHNHWLCPGWLLGEPVSVKKGQWLTVSYAYGLANNDTTWSGSSPLPLALVT